MDEIQAEQRMEGEAFSGRDVSAAELDLALQMQRAVGEAIDDATNLGAGWIRVTRQWEAHDPEAPGGKMALPPRFRLVVERVDPETVQVNDKEDAA